MSAAADNRGNVPENARAAFVADPELVCGECGKPGAFAFEGESLCPECCQERGSSCAGGGRAVRDEN